MCEDTKAGRAKRVAARAVEECMVYSINGLPEASSKANGRSVGKVNLLDRVSCMC